LTLTKNAKKTVIQTH